jgi:hypothetical protein
MAREINQRRAVSVLVLLGSILYIVVTWNYRGADEPASYRRPSEI